MKLGELLHNIPILETNADLEQEIWGAFWHSTQAAPFSRAMGMNLWPSVS